MKKKVKFGLIFGLGILALFIFFYFTGVLGGVVKQSVISPPSQVTLQNGNIYWSSTVNVNDIKEGVGFNFQPSATTLSQVVGSYPVGTKVTPQDSVIVYFSKGENYCTYQLKKLTQSRPLLALAPTLTYYELYSPQRTFMVNVCADSDCKNIDVSTPGNRLTFMANGGSLVVDPQGALVGKSDCPNNANVALYFNSKNVPAYYNEADLLDKYKYANILTSFSGLDSLIQGSIASTFVSSFTSAPTVDNGVSSIKGSMSGISFGTGQVLLTADAKFFNSAFVVPPVACNPSISSLNVNDIQQGSSGTAVLSSKADKSCTLYLSASTSRSSVTPSSTNVQATTSTSNTNFMIQCNSASGGDSLTVKVCSGNDYIGNTNCVSKTASFNCVQNDVNKCGNGVCEANLGETSNTCVADCPLPPVDPCNAPNPPSSCNKPLDCSMYSTWLIPSSPVTTVKQSCILGFIACKPATINTCEKSYSLLIILIATIIVLGLIIYFVWKSNKSNKKSKR